MQRSWHPAWHSPWRAQAMGPSYRSRELLSSPVRSWPCPSRVTNSRGQEEEQARCQNEGWAVTTEPALDAAITGDSETLGTQPGGSIFTLPGECTPDRVAVHPLLL